MTRELVAYRTGQDGDGVPMIWLPPNIPESRAVLFRMAVRFVDPALLHWLAGLPIYHKSDSVVLTKRHNIHLREGDKLRCGTMDGQEDDAGIDMELESALAVYMGEDRQYHSPNPCRICFSTGLLVGKENKEKAP